MSREHSTVSARDDRRFALKRENPRFFLFMLVVTVAVLLVALFGALTAYAQGEGGRPFSTTLSGSAEVKPPGAPGGSGTAEITLNQGQAEVCFHITVATIDTITAAHIHSGAVGTNGPVVVNFNPVVNGLDNCVSADPALMKTIRQNPEAFYINVHTKAFPAGAIRGQLSK